MPNIDLSILNQRQTPAFYADVFANRPAAGFVGRIFISTNTFAFYRDNGTSWDLIGGPGTGTVTGSGAAGQVAFWSGSSLISGENNLWWDSTNNHFGINTNTPGTAADIHHDQSTILQLNQTTATNDTRIAFQNGGSSKWRVGNFYNLGSNDYAVNDAVLNINRFTIKSSSGQTFVGDETTSSGLFVVNNSSGDAHIVALGATAPSIRVRNAGVGASLQFGLGLATTTNNFIQGATGGEFCIFNDSLTAQPILFGIKDAGLGNTQEAARISAARNFLVGTTTDAGQKLQINGTSRFSGFAFVNHSTASAYGAAIYNTNVNGEGLAIRGGSTSSHSALVVQNYDGSSTLFSVLGTGAATFNSTIGTSGDITITKSSAASFIANNTSTNGKSYRLLSADDGSFRIQNTGILDLVTITSIGAATFNSSVTAGGNIVANKNNSTDLQLILNQQTSGYASAINLVAATDSGAIYNYISSGTSGATSMWQIGGGAAVNNMSFYTAGVERGRFSSTGNLLIGTTTDNGARLNVAGTAYIATTAGTIFQAVQTAASNSVTAVISQVGAGGNGNQDIGLQINIQGANGDDRILNCRYYDGTFFNSRFSVKRSGVINMPALPTSAAGLSSGDLWNNLGIVNIVP